MNQYSKNCILCGEIDFFCLLCQENFNIKKDVDKHICCENHRKEIKNLEHVSKYRKDNIYKIKKHFYCMICNFISKDPADHIKGYDHKNKKQKKNENHQKMKIFVKLKNGLISVNNINITKLQWHGVSQSNCSVCAVAVKQVNTHIKTFDHMVNLIQTTVKSAKNMFYRKLPKNLFYCFTCYKTYNMKLLLSHLNAKCIKQSKGNNNTMMEVLEKVYEDSFTVDINNKTALCLKCNQTVAAVRTAMSKHETKHITKSDEVCLGWYYDHGKRRSELAKYGRENYIHLNERGCKGYCRLCDIFISAHIDVAKQHVHGALHRGFLELKGLVPDQNHENISYRMIPYKTFVNDLIGPFEIGENEVVCINDGICVDLISYMLIKVINDFKGPKNKCLACDLQFNFQDILHFQSKDHLNILYACKIIEIEGDEEEFVREIRPGLYHCGVCNKVLPFWENMKRHLKTFSHKMQKQKKSLMSIISDKMLLNPLCPVDSIEEYQRLISLDRF